MNKISILMPMKNAAAWVEQCIQSILHQTYTKWELIIVDDHSTDNSAKLIQKFLQDKRIFLLKNNGAGIIDALQTAWLSSSGDFITRMDADDLMPINKLSLFANALLNVHHPALVTGKVAYFSDTAISDGYQQYEKWINTRVIKDDHWREVYRECVIASPNWMTQRAVIESKNGFAHLLYPEDYDLVFDWYKVKIPIISINETTLLWREHSKRTSRNSDHYQQPAFFQLKVKRFIQNELSTQDNLVLLGAKKKGKLIASLLNEYDQNFAWYDAISSSTLHVTTGHEIQPIKSASLSSNARVIISVYPEKKEMEQLITFLTSFDLVRGKHYWFF